MGFGFQPRKHRVPTGDTATLAANEVQPPGAASLTSVPNGSQARYANGGPVPGLIARPMAPVPMPGGTAIPGMTASEFVPLPILTPVPSAPAKPAARGFRGGGLVRGPGTTTSDDIPARVAAGSYVMPADSTQRIGEDTLASMAGRGFKPRKDRGVNVRLSDREYLLDPADVHAFGVQALNQLKDATHTPVAATESALPQPQETQHFFADGGHVTGRGFKPRRYADGGSVDDPMRSTSNVTRTGNSYTGGNISGDITVNGQAPGGTTSFADPPHAAPTVAAGVAAASQPVVPGTPAAQATKATSSPSLVTPAPGSGLSIIANPPNQQVRSILDQPQQTGAAGLARGFPYGAGAARSVLGAGGMGQQNAPASNVAQQPRGARGFDPNFGRVYRQGTSSFGDSPAAAAEGAAPSDLISQQNMDAADAMAERYGARGFRPRGYANGGLITPEEALLRQQAGNGSVIGRKGERFMGMAQEVPRTALPPPGNVPATTTGVPGAIVPRTQIAEVPLGMGQRTNRFMGMADVVQPERLPGAPGTAPAAGARGFLPLAQRVAGPAAAALGVAMEGKGVLDVARDPQSTGLDVAAQTARGVGRLAAAGAGAAGGAALGAMTGPLAPAAVPIGAAAGGAYGYWVADKAIKGGGVLADAAAHAPAAVSSADGGPQSIGQIVRNAFGGRQPGAAVAAPLDISSTAYSDPLMGDPAMMAANVAPAPSQPPLMTSAAGGGRGFVNPPPAVAAPMMEPPAGGAPPLGPNGNVTTLGGWSAPTVDRVAQLNRDAQFRRDMTAQEQAQRVASGQEMAPGLVAIDGAAGAADARQRMFDEANLRTAAARGSWSPRRGFLGDEVALRAAAMPVYQRAAAEQAQAEQAGATQRAQLQEQGLNVRERMAAAQRGQANDIAGRRLAVEEAQEGRTAAESARLERLRNMLENGTPLQRRVAASTLAALKGKGVEGAGKPLTEGQSKSLLFGARMQSANETLAELAAGGKNFSTPGANTPFVRDAVNLINTEQGQRLDQAKRDFLNAVLRRESGAVIADSEFDSGNRQYFAQAGDSAKVIEQKARNRDLAMRGVLADVPDADTRLAEIRSSMSSSQSQAAEQADPPQLAELRRRAASNPQLAQRLAQMGY